MNGIIGLLLFWQSNFLISHDTVVARLSGNEEIEMRAPNVFVAGKRNEITFTLKTNSNKEWTGYVSFEITDVTDKQNVDGLFSNVFPNQYFTVSKKDSSVIQFPIAVPQQFTHPVSLFVKVMAGEKVLDSLAIIVPIKK